MAAYDIPVLEKPKKLRAGQVALVASGDLRESANQVCWAAQAEMEKSLKAAVASFGGIDPDAPLIVAEAVWQYSHHVLPGLIGHRGPILTVANWSGEWPGLVGMLNLNGSLTRAGVKYSTLWSEDFSDPAFRKKLKSWLERGNVTHRTDHVTPYGRVTIPARERSLGEALAAQLQQQKAIMGIFDEGCMGMFNAIIPDHLLNPTGVFKERLSQSALYAATMAVPDAEARAVLTAEEGRHEVPVREG